jgi:hypothetical protein
VINSDFLDLVTNLAAVFCKRCNLLSSIPGSPYSRQLHESTCSFDVTKAWRSLSQSACDRCFLILPMFLMVKEADLQTFYYIMAFSFSKQNVTDKFLTALKKQMT